MTDRTTKPTLSVNARPKAGMPPIRNEILKNRIDSLQKMVPGADRRSLHKMALSSLLLDANNRFNGIGYLYSGDADMLDSVAGELVTRIVRIVEACRASLDHTNQAVRDHRDFEERVAKLDSDIRSFEEGWESGMQPTRIYREMEAIRFAKRQPKWPGWHDLKTKHSPAAKMVEGLERKADRKPRRHQVRSSAVQVAA